MFEKHRSRCPKRPRPVLPIAPAEQVLPEQVLPEQVAPEQAPAQSPNQNAISASPVPPTAQWQEQEARLLQAPPPSQTSASPIAPSPSILSPIPFPASPSAPPSPVSSTNGTEYVNIYDDAWSFPTTPEQAPAFDFVTGDPNAFGFDGSENTPSSAIFAAENWGAMDFDSEIAAWF
ncbi:hypothetical protein QBC46DRAFT_337993 [Diplogelasinospora grovesii]|uniref:Uncharacterized protein n=1 Tax=Diplogelasinospora grovesii TaxID=303347 RepID=A0AAN6NHU1_9PEZI|nr:hypothetical protein QBC46DRAFT_337993 [Diplogelasinospora grovesii]